MLRTQFTLKTLLWLMVAAAAFFAGMAIRRQPSPVHWEQVSNTGSGEIRTEYVTMPDGTTWQKVEDQ